MGRRFFGYGELALVLLALLEQRPQSAYELMSELRRLFAPAYRPSPGSVYPALRALHDEGLVSAHEDASVTTYRITDAGRTVRRDRRVELAALEDRTGRSLGIDGDVDGALARLTARVRALSGRVPPDVIEQELEDAANRLEAAAPMSAGGR